MSIVRWFSDRMESQDLIGGTSGRCLMFCAWRFPSGQISLVRCSGHVSKVHPMLPVEIFNIYITVPVTAWPTCHPCTSRIGGGQGEASDIYAMSTTSRSFTHKPSPHQRISLMTSQGFKRRVVRAVTRRIKANPTSGPGTQVMGEEPKTSEEETHTRGLVTQVASEGPSIPEVEAPTESRSEQLPHQTLSQTGSPTPVDDQGNQNVDNTQSRDQLTHLRLIHDLTLHQLC